MSPRLDFGPTARSLLRECDRTSVALLDSLRGRQVEIDLDRLHHLLRRWGLEEVEEAQLLTITSEVLEGNEVDTADVKETLDILSRCKDSLKASLVYEYGAPTNGEEPAEESSERAIYDHLSGTEPRQDRLETLNQTIHSQPGLYIKELWRTYQRSRPQAVTYGTIHKDVDLLEQGGRIVTLGGPSGRNRYCFPHPDSISDWSQYYGRLGAIEGTVEEQLTDEFGPPLRGGWKDVYLLNSQVDPTILITEYDEARLEPGAEIRCSGRINPYSESQLKRVGLRHVQGEIQAQHLLEAVQISPASDRNVTIYQDADLFSRLR